MNHINFINNPTADKDPDNYIEIQINTAKTLESWKLSITSFEWLDKNGKIKPLKDIKDGEREKRAEIENALKNNQPIAKAILGIGLYDNIEIGSAKVEFLTIAAGGFQTIPVHIRKSQQDDFKEFLADVN